MHRIDPAAVRRRLRTFDIEIYDNGILPAANHHRFHGVVRIGIDLLMRKVGRNEHEVARPGLIGELQVFAPAESRAALNDIKDRLQVAMMVRAGLGVRIY